MRIREDYKNYLANKRVALIKKANRNLHLQIQFINNELVDRKILTWNDEYSSDIRDPYNPVNIQTNLLAYNRLATSKDLQRVLKHSVITRNPQTELDARRILETVANDITTIEVERTVKNLNYIENVLTTSNVNISKYEALIEKLPASISRKEVIERCILNEDTLPPSKRQAWLERNLERGASYNKTYTYKELNQLSQDLERYKTNRLDYEKALLENRQANREGYEDINQTKTWIWSTLERTRHSQMDGETIPVTSKFEVFNEQNGDVDYLLFPGDVSNDHNNCSNICNCQCSYKIN